MTKVYPPFTLPPPSPPTLTQPCSISYLSLSSQSQKISTKAGEKMCLYLEVDKNCNFKKVHLMSVTDTVVPLLLPQAASPLSRINPIAPHTLHPAFPHSTIVPTGYGQKRPLDIVKLTTPCNVLGGYWTNHGLWISHRLFVK